MNAVYVMVFGAAMSLGFNGAFEASYKAFQQDGVSAAASAFLESTREALKAQDQSSLVQEREAHRVTTSLPNALGWSQAAERRGEASPRVIRQPSEH